MSPGPPAMLVMDGFALTKYLASYFMSTHSFFISDMALVVTTAYSCSNIVLSPNITSLHVQLNLLCFFVTFL